MQDVQTMNIKSVPLNGLLGANKYFNDDWGTKAYFILRNSLNKKFTNSAFKYNSIYFLIGTEDGVEKIYVGQAKIRNDGTGVIERLREHHTSTTEAYKDIWEYTVIFNNESWGPTELNVLENIFYNLIDNDIRLNGNEPNSGCINDNEKSRYDEKVRQIINYLTIIGINIFKPSEDDEKQLSVVGVVEDEEDAGHDMHYRNKIIPEFITPRKVVDQMLDMLDKSVWNSQSKFIDLACKGGEYLREIYDRLMNSERVIRDFKDPTERSIHILTEQLYGIALSIESEQRTKRKLLGFSKNSNIKYIAGFVYKLKAYKKRQNVIKEIFKEVGWEQNMQFNVVIGNPPYQENTASIYQYFIEAGLDLSNNVCMITRNNWLTSDTLKDTRNKMIEAGLKEIVNYPVIHELFNGANVQVAIFNTGGGIGNTVYKEVTGGKEVSSYRNNFKDYPIIFKNVMECSIYSKVKSTKTFSFHVLPTEPFRVATNGTVGRGSNTYYFNDIDKKDKDHDVIVAYMNSDNSIYYRYSNKDAVPARSELVDTYKVLCGRMMNNTKNCITNITFLNTHSICSSSLAVLFTGEDPQEVYNVGVYCRSKFFRFLVRLLCDSTRCVISPYRFSLVPEQDYTNQSDIQWGPVKKILDVSDIKAIDNQLYKKYNLSSDEIAYIEKEMSYN